MTEETRTQVIEVFKPHGYEPEEWAVDDCGDISVESDADWAGWEIGGDEIADALTVKRSSGWYEQYGEARSVMELDRLIEAMTRADRELCRALSDTP